MKLKIFKNKKALSAILIIFVVFAVGLLFFILFSPVQKTEAALPGVCGDNARGCREDPYNECDNSADACGGSYAWGLTSGDAFSPYCWYSKCCGDDSGEFYRTKSCQEGTCGFSRACCNASTDCVYNGSCYTSGEYPGIDATGDGDKDYCDAGTWKTCQCFSVSECCDGCHYKPSGTICRDTGGEVCDTAETCTGISDLCPADLNTNGNSCRNSEGDGYCFEKECKTAKEIDVKNDTFRINWPVQALIPNQAIGTSKGSVVISSTVQLDNGAYLIFGEGKNLTFSGNGKVILPTNQQSGMIKAGRTTTITNRVAKICVQDNDNDGYWTGYGELADSDGNCLGSRKDASYLQAAGDCDDTSAVRHQYYSILYKDKDNDRYGSNKTEEDILTEVCPIMSGTNCSSTLADAVSGVCLSTNSNDCNDGVNYIIPGWSGWEITSCVLTEEEPAYCEDSSTQYSYEGREVMCQPECYWIDGDAVMPRGGCGAFPPCESGETGCLGMDTSGKAVCWCCPGGCLCGDEPELAGRCLGSGSKWSCQKPPTLFDFYIADVKPPTNCGSGCNNPAPTCTVYGKKCRQISCKNDGSGSFLRGLWSECVSDSTPCEQTMPIEE